MAAAFRHLDLAHPIFQAPIGGIAGPDLAAAVSNAGGLGHLACTWTPPDQLRAAFAAIRKQTARPFGANFVLDFPIADRLALALDEGVQAISFFWGSGAAHIDGVKAAGAVAIQVVGSIAEARVAAAAGFDLIVAQGQDAGGHVRGGVGTFALVPQVVDAVGSIPVLAAGGIGDARGVAAALALGAAGVWVGTRFLAAAEADIHPGYRDRLLTATGDDTVYSELFDIGWPAAPMRTLKNPATAAWEAAGRPVAPHRPGEGEAIGRRADGTAIPRYSFSSPVRTAEGGIDEMALYAGAGVGLVTRVEPAADIVRQLAAAIRAPTE